MINSHLLPPTELCSQNRPLRPQTIGSGLGPQDTTLNPIGRVFQWALVIPLIMVNLYYLTICVVRPFSPVGLEPVVGFEPTTPTLQKWNASNCVILAKTRRKQKRLRILIKVAVCALATLRCGEPAPRSLLTQQRHGQVCFSFLGLRGRERLLLPHRPKFRRRVQSCRSPAHSPTWRSRPKN